MKIKTKKDGEIHEVLHTAVVNHYMYFVIAGKTGKFRMINMDDALYVKEAPTKKKKVVKSVK